MHFQEKYRYWDFLQSPANESTRITMIVDVIGMERKRIFKNQSSLNQSLQIQILFYAYFSTDALFLFFPFYRNVHAEQMCFIMDLPEMSMLVDALTRIFLWCNDDFCDIVVNLPYGNAVSNIVKEGISLFKCKCLRVERKKVELSSVRCS